MYALLKLPKRSVSLLACSTLSKTNIPLCTELILLAEILIQGNPTGWIKLFGKPNLIKLIESVASKLTINKHLGVLPTGIPTEWIMSSEV
jgi:hypothetical protein